MSENGIVTIVVALIVAVTPALLARALIVPKIVEIVPQIVSEIVPKVTTVEAKANEIIVQNVELKSLANGTHSALTSDLSTANAKVEGLERLVAALQSREKI